MLVDGEWRMSVNAAIIQVQESQIKSRKIQAWKGSFGEGQSESQRPLENDSG